MEVEPDEYEPPADLSSDDDYITAEEVESSRVSRLRAGLLATRQRTRDNLRRTGATLKQGGVAFGGRVRGLGQRVVPEEQRTRLRERGQRIRQTIAEKAPNIRLRPPRSVAEGEEGGAEGDAAAQAAVTPPKGKRKDVTDVTERQGPLSEEGATSVPLDGKKATEE